LDEVLEIEIVIFIKGLSLNAASKVLLRVEKLSKPHLIKPLSLMLKLESHPYKLVLLIRVSILLVSHLRSWKGRNVSSSMVMSIFKSIERASLQTR